MRVECSEQRKANAQNITDYRTFSIVHLQKQNSMLFVFTFYYLCGWIELQLDNKRPAAPWCFHLVNRRSYFSLGRRIHPTLHPILFHFLGRIYLYKLETYSLPTLSVIYQSQSCLIKIVDV